MQGANRERDVHVSSMNQLEVQCLVVRHHEGEGCRHTEVGEETDEQKCPAQHLAVLDNSEEFIYFKVNCENRVILEIISLIYEALGEKPLL